LVSSWSSRCGTVYGLAAVDGDNGSVNVAQISRERESRRSYIIGLAQPAKRNRPPHDFEAAGDIGVFHPSTLAVDRAGSKGVDPDAAAPVWPRQ
jgi:hypothetical protein